VSANGGLQYIKIVQYTYSQEGDEEEEE
jgi:hypothetical protein